MSKGEMGENEIWVNISVYTESKFNVFEFIKNGTVLVIYTTLFDAILGLSYSKL